MGDLWTLCPGCYQPVDVRRIPADRPGDGSSWEFLCKKCEWYEDADMHHADLDVTADAPPPPDPLVVLAAIVGPVVERAGREAVAKALGFEVTNG